MAAWKFFEKTGKNEGATEEKREESSDCAAAGEFFFFPFQGALFSLSRHSIEGTPSLAGS
jgi:hypothetical protein